MDILFLDEVLIAVHKPAGLLVHRSLIDKGAKTFALQLVRDLIGQRVYPVHRLDRPTSGVLLFARDPATARALVAQFTAGRVSKTYQAIVRGHTDAAGTIDHALPEEVDRIADPLADPHKPPQPAVTGYRRLATVELPFPVGRYRTARYSLLELSPQTGRRHQLRRHLKHIFHPIIGDTTHGDGRHNCFFREQFGNARLLLVATRVCLDHPTTGQRLRIEAPPAEDFASTARALGWNLATQSLRESPSLMCCNPDPNAAS
ncbi:MULTISPECIES: tRNA pseudouridine(65) synthase TruC [Thiorhodovibrio]|uniref:tRNA pseudouridine(65) synthase TruC n=1 Tax=Thiorhodovibrio TaxID=61593 RepID=UPI001913F332|nr:MULTISPECIES: tRNA pseudouridine(65) synthase TruC [Thiorhodovibrio]MBK5970104.1 pseudouridylate synthase [Thiorhodovibrio winogradskyi]WPL13486.1 tRNA pseudouridine synthase C [Thiorhodovibrio litoralis]